NTLGTHKSDARKSPPSCPNESPPLESTRLMLAFLKSIPGLQRSRHQPQNCLLVVLSAITRNEGAEPILATAPKGCHSRGIINMIIDGSASARIYRCSISPGE